MGLGLHNFSSRTLPHMIWQAPVCTMPGMAGRPDKDKHSVRHIANPSWGRLWADLGLTQGPSRPALGQLWADFRPTWGDIGPTLEGLLVDFGLTLGQLWADVGVTLRQLSANFGRLSANF